MNCNPALQSRNDRRRAMRPFGILFVVYLACAYALENAQPVRNSPLAYALALATGFSITAMLVAGGIGLARQRDEFQRKLLMEAMIWGLGGMLAITTIWGLLEVHTYIPHLSTLFNFPIFLSITAIAKVTLFRSNAVGGEEA